jgi:hypothetical protein
LAPFVPADIWLARNPPGTLVFFAPFPTSCTHTHFFTSPLSGFGFIQFDDPKVAEDCCRDKHDQELQGKKITVQVNFSTRLLIFCIYRVD